MDDLFKKFINTGVGFLSQGNKAVQKAIEKLVQESKISEQEGKKIVDDLLKNSESKRADLEQQFKGLTADLKSRVARKGKAQPAATAAKPKSTAKKAAASATAEDASPAKKAAAKKSPAAAKSPRPAAKASALKKATPAADDASAAAEVD